MSERKFLSFQCKKCKQQEFVDAVEDPEGGFEIDETWPIGWLEIYSCGIGLTAQVKDTFCNTCKVPVLEALGYASYKDYISVVKVNTEINRRLDEVCSDEDEFIESVPFYLIDSDEDVN